jgi:hypothetical protein
VTLPFNSYKYTSFRRTDQGCIVVVGEEKEKKGGTLLMNMNNAKT